MSVKSLQVVGNSPYGGGGYSLRAWCSYLASLNTNVDVLATDPVVISELASIPGVRIIDSIYIPRRISLINDLAALVRLFLLLRREKYDVVHTYTATPSFLGRIAARIAGIPVILRRAAGWPVNEFSSLLERLLYTPLEYLATTISTKAICVSHAMVEEARRFHIAPEGKLVTIRSGIDAGPIMSARREMDGNRLRRRLEIGDDVLVIGNTGRLAPQKDNSTLINAMAFLESHEDSKFALLLAGEGPDRRNLEDQIGRLGMSSRVKILGFYKYIPEFLAAVDIFVSPSLWEGLSISLIEAMAARKPIITTSIPPNAELIEHGVTGLLIPPRSPMNLANAIKCFVDDPELARMCASNAQRRALKNHTIDRMCAETWALYTGLLESKRPEVAST